GRCGTEELRMNPIIQAILARIGSSNHALVGSGQIGDAMTAGLNNPQLNAVIAKHLPPMTPNARVLNGWDQFSPVTDPAPMLPTPPTPPPVDMGPGALSQANPPAAPPQ